LCSEHLNAFGGCEGLGFMVRAVRLGGGVVTWIQLVHAALVVNKGVVREVVTLALVSVGESIW